jgi:L-fuculose-phosphate aldolase
MASRGYSIASEGNLSTRTDLQRILITPSDRNLGRLIPKEVVVLDLDGNVLQGKCAPSSEMPMHVAIYRTRQDIRGICHAHPVYATGFATTGIPLDSHILPEVVYHLGEIPLVPFVSSVTDADLLPLLNALKDHDACLLANHGVVTLGTDIWQAFDRMELVEQYAHILFVSRMLGKVNPLDNARLKVLLNLHANLHKKE